MVNYSCSDCGKEFSQKSHYDTHKNKKIPCVLRDQSMDEYIENKVKKEVEKKIKKSKKKTDTDSTVSEDNIMSDTSDEHIKVKKKQPKKKPVKKSGSKKKVIIDDSYLRNPTNEKIFEISQENDKQDDKQYVLSKIKQAHQILYENENIEGENAMNDIMNLIFLRLIQDKLSDKKELGKIDLLNKEYYDGYDDDELDEIFQYFNIEKLAEADLGLLRSKKDNDIIRQMGYILKKHPVTSSIFLEENFLKIEKSVTLQSLINTMFINTKTKWDINKMYEIEDLIGEIFESFINGYTKTNSKLSQFFTPRNLMYMILSYKRNELKKHLKNEKEYHVADFCMGTAGWLVIFYNMFKKDKIQLSGGEVKPNTFQYGLMNMITTTNHLPYYVQRENSLTHVNKNKYHLIITNPPFKTDFKFDNIKKNFNHDEYTKKNKVKLDDVYELKDNNPPIQFLELCIYKLHDEGKCIIVLPYGELFFGSSYKKAREHFLDIINITDIILCPSGVFTHTGIKTCIMIFDKDDNGTKEINFLQTNKQCTKMTKITSIKKEDILKESNFSFYHRDYLNDEYITELTTKMQHFEWVEFGEVFKLEKGQLQSSKVEECDNENDNIPIISIAEKIKYINNIDEKLLLDNENIWICTTSSGTSCGPYETKIKYFNGKCSFTNLLCRCVLNDKYNNKINLKFMYYYLNSVKKHIEVTYGRGSCNQSLDQKNFNRMKIPIPNMEIQEQIVNFINNLSEDILLYKQLQKNQTKRINSITEHIIKKSKNKTSKQFDEVCTYLESGKCKSSDATENGLYPLHYCSIKQTLLSEKYDFDGEGITINTTNGSGKSNVFYTNGKYTVAESTFHFTSKKNEVIRTKYIYLYMKLTLNSLEKLYKGSQQYSIKKEDLNSKYKIVYIPIEEQDKLIKLVNEIEDVSNMLINKIANINNKLNNTFLEYLQEYE